MTEETFTRAQMLAEVDRRVERALLAREALATPTSHMVGSNREIIARFIAEDWAGRPDSGSLTADDYLGFGGAYTQADALIEQLAIASNENLDPSQSYPKSVTINDLDGARKWLSTRWCIDHPNEGHVKQLAEYAASLRSSTATEGE